MSLLDEARAEQHVNGDVCSLAEYLPDPDLEEALEAVANKLLKRPGVRLDGSALARTLEKVRHIKLSGQTVRRHARRECQCWPDVAA